MAKKSKKKAAVKSTRAGRKISVNAVATLAEETALNLKHALELNQRGLLGNNQGELDQMNAAKRFLDNLVGDMRTRALNAEICPQVYEIKLRATGDRIIRKKHSK